MKASKTIVFLTLTASFWLYSTIVFPQSGDRQSFRVSQNPAYLKPRATLHLLITKKAKAHHTNNNFCVIGYRKQSSAKSELGSAWVYWQEQKAIILWEPWADGITDLTLSRHYLKMPDDFVRSQKEVGASTYLETWEWADKLINECLAKGDKYKF